MFSALYTPSPVTAVSPPERGNTREIFSTLARIAAMNAAQSAADAALLVDGSTPAPTLVPRALLAVLLQSTCLVPGLGACIVDRAFGGTEADLTLAAFRRGVEGLVGTSTHRKLEQLFDILGAAAHADHSAVDGIAMCLETAYTLETSCHPTNKEPFHSAARRAAIVASASSTGTDSAALLHGLASWALDQLPSLQMVLVRHVLALCCHSEGLDAAMRMYEASQRAKGATLTLDLRRLLEAPKEEVSGQCSCCELL